MAVEKHLVIHRPLAIDTSQPRDRNRLLQGVGQKTGPHTHMTMIMSILNRFKQFFSLEDSAVNLRLNGHQKSHRTLHMLLHDLVKH